MFHSKWCNIYQYIYTYIYIVIHRQTCLVLSDFFSVARQARFPKLGSKPSWLKRQSINQSIYSAFNKSSDFFVQAFKIVVDSWKFSMLLLYILWDDWPIFMISSSNEQLQQQLEYTLLNPDCHSWWISKIQSGREGTLEERYAIKFCFKLEKKKNATETYRILQTAFGASCMNRVSVFEWHKRFKEGKESVRDDEMCGRSKELRTPELIGQIKNFMDKDRRVSTKTISAQFDVSVGTVHTIIREELKMWKICAKFVPRVLREDQKERRCHDSREMVELINSDPAVLDALVTCDESWIYGYDLETKRQSSHWKHAGSPRPKKARQSKSTHKLLMTPLFDSTGMIYMHWVPNGQTFNKEYYVEVLREFRKRFLGKRLALFKSDQWHFHEDNAPVYNSILVTDYLTKMGIKTVPHPPYSPDLAPCDFCLFPKLKENLRGCRNETIEEMKEAVTKVIDTLTQEDFHGAFQKLLERYNKCIAAGGDYFEGE